MPIEIIIILISLGALVFLFIMFFVLQSILSKNKIKKMYRNVEEVIASYVKRHSDIASYELVEGKCYQYIVRTEKIVETVGRMKTESELHKFEYYIKVIPNFSNDEITINNSTMWQLKRSFNDESKRFVPDIEEFMRLDLPIRTDEGRETKKIFLVYPNAKSLLMYINECEMKFVNYDTDVYSSNVMTYVNLLENGDSIL